MRIRQKLLPLLLNRSRLYHSILLRELGKILFESNALVVGDVKVKALLAKGTAGGTPEVALFCLGRGAGLAVGHMLDDGELARSRVINQHSSWRGLEFVWSGGWFGICASWFRPG